MIKRSRLTRISSDLDKEIRDFAKKNDLTIVQASNNIANELRKWKMQRKKIRDITF